MIHWRLIVGLLCLVIGVSLVFLGGILAGRQLVMRHTVVRLDTPFYRGVYFGKCWKQDAAPQLRAPSMTACATVED